MNEKLNNQKVLSILDRVAYEFSGELDLESVLKSTARLLRGAVSFTAFVIALKENDGEFKVFFQEGYEQGNLKQACANLKNAILGDAVEKKEIVIVEDVSKSDKHIPVKTLDGKEVRSVLATPLISKDQVVGVIGMESNRLNAFNRQHGRLMASIAAHIASAVTNARLYEDSLEQIKLMRVIEQIGLDLTSVLDIETLLKEISRLTRQLIEFQAFGIFLTDREKNRFEPRFVTGYDRDALRTESLSIDKGIKGKVVASGRPMLCNDLLNQPEHVSYKMEFGGKIRSQIYIPLKTRKTIVGVLVMGNIKENFYTNRHMRIARGLANQYGVALTNASAFEKVSESEGELRHEMEIARNMQLSMLPNCCPFLAGYEISAFSKPTVRVGGDFYDFINIDENRLGIVVGDVSGFGVSGALVMASAREVMRIYSEIDPDPAAVMNRADLRLNKDLTNHMFVALLYGVLDLEKSEFTFCNAGLIEPVIACASGARYLDSPGTRLPLGKMPDGNYQPATVKLEPGDQLLFTSDGSIEVQNPEGEQLGFDRFIDLVNEFYAQRSDNHPSPEFDIISYIRRQITRFSVTGRYNDDITLLSVRKQGNSKFRCEINVREDCNNCDPRFSG